MQLELNSFQERCARNGLNANKNFIDELKIVKKKKKHTRKHWSQLNSQKKKKRPYFTATTSQCIINIATANNETV